MPSPRSALAAVLALALLPALPLAAGAQDDPRPVRVLTLPAPDADAPRPQSSVDGAGARTRVAGGALDLGAAQTVARTWTVTRPRDAARAAAYLAEAVDGRSELPEESMGSRHAYLTVMALVEVGGYDAQVAAVVDDLEREAATVYAGGAGRGPHSASAALAAVVAGRDARSFGGVDLVAGILGDLEDDGWCGRPGFVREQATCLLALHRAGAAVPPSALASLVDAADPATGGYEAVEGWLGLRAGASAVEALASLDPLPGARGSALGARDQLVLSATWDKPPQAADRAAAASALDLVGEDTTDLLPELAAEQLPDGSLPADPATSSVVEATALAALAFLGESVASAGPGGVQLVDYWAHPVVERVDGKDRYAVAAEISRAWTEGASTVFVVSGATFPDALSASALASYYGGPVLLTRQGKLPPETVTALERLDPHDIVILGGKSTVSADVQRKLGPYATRGVHRIEGADRYAVSAETAYHWEAGADHVFVATGANWPDGLTGGALAGSLGEPLLLTRPTKVPSTVMAALQHLRPTSITVLGGADSVSADVLRQLRKVAPVTRIGGSNRYEVARRVALEFGPGEVAYTATGLNWPDALAGSALAGAVGAPVLLVRPEAVPTATLSALTQRQPWYIAAFGGSTTIQPGTLTQLRLQALVQ